MTLQASDSVCYYAPGRRPAEKPACREDLEGIVAKLKDGRYNPDRQSSWIKIKNPAYTQIVGRQDLFQKEKARDNLGYVQEIQSSTKRLQISDECQRCSPMKNVYEVLRQKEREISRLKKEGQALRVAAPLLSEGEEADNDDKPTRLSAVNADDVTRW